mmetsp:Transcript_53049/g.141086  ORF Transcript_53049/g.141086 Transcript_53049/m.141086 type:complete len:201 (-) Transcript_53049:983-1585(-)
MAKRCRRSSGLYCIWTFLGGFADQAEHFRGGRPAVSGSISRCLYNAKDLKRWRRCLLGLARVWSRTMQALMHLSPAHRDMLVLWLEMPLRPSGSWPTKPWRPCRTRTTSSCTRPSVSGSRCRESGDGPCLMLPRMLSRARRFILIRPTTPSRWRTTSYFQTLRTKTARIGEGPCPGESSRDSPWSCWLWRSTAAAGAWGA